MRGKSLIIALVVLILFPTPPVFAEIYINEFSSSTSSDDWVEFYNNDSNQVDLSQYMIRDNSATNKLILSGIINAKSFKVFGWNNKLNNGGDILKLVAASNENQIFDQIGYGSEGELLAPTGNQTAGRKTDGGSEWVLFETGTKEYSNGGSSIVPTPTPTPVPTVKPTSTPKPTKISTPPISPESSQISHISPTSLIANSRKPNTSIDPSRFPKPILGASKSADRKASKSAESKNGDEGTSKPSSKMVLGKNNFRFVALGIGILALACAIIFFIKIRRNLSN